MDKLFSWHQRENHILLKPDTPNDDHPHEPNAIRLITNVSVNIHFEFQSDHDIKDEKINLRRTVHLPCNDPHGNCVDANINNKGKFTETTHQYDIKCDSDSIRHFLDKASGAADAVMMGLQEFIFQKGLMILPQEILEIVRLLEDQATWLKGGLFRTLLIALLKNPSQSLFLETPKSVAEHLDVNDFMQVTNKIFTVEDDRGTAQKYKSLFMEFWKLGIKSQKSHPTLKSMLVRDLLHQLIVKQDVPLAYFVLEDIHQTYLDKYLFNFDSNCIILQLLYEKMYPELEAFISVCRMVNPVLFSKFQSLFGNYSTCQAPISNLIGANVELSKIEDRMRLLIKFFIKMDKFSPKKPQIS